MEHSKHPFVPAFDPDHTDEEILSAFAKVCNLRAQSYDLEGTHGSGHEQQGEYDRIAAEIAAVEPTVFGNFASTPAGVAAQLTLALDHIEPALWADQAIARGDIRSVYEAREDLDFGTSQVALAIYELLTVEWKQALAEYERAAAVARAANEMLGAVIHLSNQAGTDGPALRAVVKLAEEQGAASSAAPEIRRLIRTLTPDGYDLQRKLEIIMDEEWEEDVQPWIARDAKFLFAGKAAKSPPPAAIGAPVAAIKQAA